MSQQPEAIRLAAVCDLGHPLEDDVVLIGPELLRLHAVESGAKVELMRRDNLIDSLHGLCESYRTQVESLQAAQGHPATEDDLWCLLEVVTWHMNKSAWPGLYLTQVYGIGSKFITDRRARLIGEPNAMLATPQPEPAPVAAVPALVQLTEEQIKACWVSGAVGPFEFARASIAEFCRINGLTVGDGAQPIKDTP